MQRLFFFSKNGPVDPHRKIFLVKDHIPTYMEKLITFRIPPGLIKMYVLAAVTRSGRFYDKSNFSFFICSFQFQLNSKKKFQFAHFTLLFAYTLLNFYSTRSKIEANLLAYLLCSLKISK